MQTHHMTHGVLQDVVPDSSLVDRGTVCSPLVSHTFVFVVGFVAHWWATKRAKEPDRQTADPSPFVSLKSIASATRQALKHGLRYIGLHSARYIGLSIFANLSLPVLSIFSLWVVLRDAVLLCILWTVANALVKRTFAVQAHLQEPTPWNFRHRRPAAWKPLQGIAALSDVTHKVLTVNFLIVVAMQAVLLDSMVWALVTLFTVGTATMAHFVVSNKLSALVKEQRELIANRHELVDRRFRPLTVMKRAILKMAKDGAIALVLASVRVLYMVLATLVKHAILYTIVNPSVAVLHATTEKLTKKVLGDERSSFFAYAVRIARAILVNVASLGMLVLGPLASAVLVNAASLGVFVLGPLASAVLVNAARLGVFLLGHLARTVLVNVAGIAVFLLAHLVHLLARIVTSLALWITAGPRKQLMHYYDVIKSKLGMGTRSAEATEKPANGSAAIGGDSLCSAEEDSLPAAAEEKPAVQAAEGSAAIDGDSLCSAEEDLLPAAAAEKPAVQAAGGSPAIGRRSLRSAVPPPLPPRSRRSPVRYGSR